VTFLNNNQGVSVTHERAANAANHEDAILWRWFSLLFEEGRIRWCRSSSGWLVSIDHKHLSTEDSFDEAIREAKLKLSIRPTRKKSKS
jgi:hypothetical protein